MSVEINRPPPLGGAPSGTMLSPEHPEPAGDMGVHFTKADPTKKKPPPGKISNEDRAFILRMVKITPNGGPRKNRFRLEI